MKVWRISWRGGRSPLHYTTVYREEDVKRVKRNVKAFGGKYIKVKVFE